MTGTGRPSRANATGQRETSSRRFIAGAVLDDTLRSRVQSGNRINLHQFQALEALMVDVGDPVWACGRTAAALHRFDEFVLGPPFHLLLVRGRHVNRIGNVIHTTNALDPIDRESAYGLAVTSPARTIIDLIRVETPQRVTLAIDSALRDGGTVETHLHQRIAALRTRGRHGMPKLLRLIEGSELTRGGHSWLERRFLEMCDQARLPRPLTQQTLTKARDRLVRVDFRFPDSPVVVEVLGYRFHRTNEQMQRDAERMNRLTLEGYLVLQFTYLGITEAPELIVEQVARALRIAPPELLEPPEHALTVSTKAHRWPFR